MIGKFKVWDNTAKKFIENERDFFINHEGELWEEVETAYDCNKIEKVDLSYWEFTIVFSTGKTDKNGVEWHTGELIDMDQEKYPGEHYKRIIIFEDGAFRLWTKSFEDQCLKMPVLFDDTLIDDFVSIGNKFDFY